MGKKRAGLEPGAPGVRKRTGARSEASRPRVPPSPKKSGHGQHPRILGHPKTREGASLSFPWKSGGGKAVARPGPRPSCDLVSPPSNTVGPGPLRPDRASTPRTVRSEVPHESPPRILWSTPDMDSPSAPVCARARPGCMARRLGERTLVVPLSSAARVWSWVIPGSRLSRRCRSSWPTSRG